ncbi:carbamoylsarcosine amidase [Bacillus sp. M6-12]|nr:carbamoylsarcosine amidase [Bacillus sp. M6-12]
MEEEQFLKERGFGLTIGFGVRPAILVIDMVNAFTDYKNPEMLLAANLDKQIVEIKQILDVARRKQIPIIFTTVAYDDGDLKDAGVWARKQKGVITLRNHTPEVQVNPALEYQNNEMLLVKKYASAFFGTDLIPRLVSQQVDTLIITGCTTSGCVRATAVDAISSGYRPIVVSDAVGDRLQSAHEQSLLDLQAKYADVTGTQDVISYLEELDNPI